MKICAQWYMHQNPVTIVFNIVKGKLYIVFLPSQDPACTGVGCHKQTKPDSLLEMNFQKTSKSCFFFQSLY